MKWQHSPHATRIHGYSIMVVLVYQGEPNHLLISADGTELGRYHTYAQAHEALTEHRFWQATAGGTIT